MRNDLEAVLRYHDETKHHFHRFARSLGYLDWATQPLPFRRFRGAPVIELPRHTQVQPHRRVSYDELFRPGDRVPARVDIDSLGQLFRYSLGLSAWKEFGSERWALRVNPSSGNLHPTEAYLVIGPVAGLGDATGVYHYAPELHALEARCELGGSTTTLAAGPAPAFLVGLSSIHWREIWKYGERAFRYCQHDLGHAVGALRFSASLLGWNVAILPEMSDAATATLLGLDREEDFAGAERESPGCVLHVGPPAAAGTCVVAPAAALAEAATAGRWHGTADRLSRNHTDWPIIDEVEAATRKPSVAVVTPAPVPAGTGRSDHHSKGVEAQRILLKRRSAVAFDRTATCPLPSVVSLMRRVLPPSGPPWDALWWPPAIHLVFFVHAVDRLEAGIYALVRHPDAFGGLRAAMHPTFLWKRPDALPDDLPAYLLLGGDVRRLAATLSCTQAIAGDSCFSLAMLGEFEGPLHQHGPWFYRHLFWESGLIGQVLYLEAEAHEARGTGIGCFFDDAVHDALGLKCRAFQSLYHFTVGVPVEDRRLTTLPGYAWEAATPSRPCPPTPTVRW